MLKLISFFALFITIFVLIYVLLKTRKTLSLKISDLHLETSRLEFEREMDVEHAEILVKLLTDEEQYVQILEKTLSQYKRKDFLQRSLSKENCNPSIEISRHRFLKLTDDEVKVVNDLESKTFYNDHTGDLLGTSESPVVIYRDVEDFTLELQSADDWILNQTTFDKCGSSITAPVWSLCRESNPKHVIELSVPFNRTLVDQNGSVLACRCDIELRLIDGIWQWVISCSQDSILWSEPNLDLQTLTAY